MRNIILEENLTWLASQKILAKVWWYKKNPAWHVPFVSIKHYGNDANVSQNLKNRNKFITAVQTLESLLSPITKHASRM
jgi:hypothetical protein